MILIFRRGSKLQIVAILLFVLFIAFYLIQAIGTIKQQSDHISSAQLLITDGEKTITMDSTGVSYGTSMLTVHDFACELRRVEKQTNTLITIYDLDSLITYLDSNHIEWQYFTSGG